MRETVDAYFHFKWTKKRGAAQWGYLLIGGLFFLASRDALRKYYERAQSLLCPKVDAPGPIIITPD